MKLIVNEIESKNIFKILREKIGYTQSQLAIELNRRSRHGIKNIEAGYTRYYFETILEVCKHHKINIIFEKKNKMKFIANEYEPKETFKILREWTELTQDELAKELNFKSKYGLKKYETGENRFYFDTILEICKKHDIILYFEKYN